eukprot:TRINITY_DN5753_c1_g1_i1.p1 TRINITY_DN5753_c1_g1~~TRINITY_DN5753_c1_g1_i1.p1  ORF type:complete len:633 (-),score=131.14 TRINITY_DN5753_c1_g1_i1:186-2084(-)
MYSRSSSLPPGRSTPFANRPATPSLQTPTPCIGYGGSVPGSRLLSTPGDLHPISLGGGGVGDDVGDGVPNSTGGVGAAEGVSTAANDFEFGGNISNLSASLFYGGSEDARENWYEEQAQSAWQFRVPLPPSTRPVSIGDVAAVSAEEASVPRRRAAINAERIQSDELIADDRSGGVTTATMPCEDSGHCIDDELPRVTAELAALGRRLDAQGKHLAVVGAWAQRQQLLQICDVVWRDDLLRAAFRVWHAEVPPGTVTTRKACVDEESIARLNDMCRRTDEHAASLEELQRCLEPLESHLDAHDARIKGLDEVSCKQEEQLATLRASLHATPTRIVADIGPMRVAQVEELLDTLTSQALAVEDLGLVVRGEISEGRRLVDAKADLASADLEAERDTLELLFRRVAMQGRSIEELHALTQELHSKLQRFPSFAVDGQKVRDGACGEEVEEEAQKRHNSGANHAMRSSQLSPYALGDSSPINDHSFAFSAEDNAKVAEFAACLPFLEGRVAGLEDAAESTHRQLSVLTLLVRQVRDRAADAFEDRVAAALGEVQGCFAGSLAAVRQAAHRLRDSTACGDHIAGDDEDYDSDEKEEEEEEEDAQLRLGGAGDPGGGGTGCGGGGGRAPSSRSSSAS